MSTVDRVPAMDATEARALTDDIKNHATAVWTLLTRAHQGRAWKSLGYETWAEYVGTEFDLSRGRSYQIIDQARVIFAIEEAVSTKVDISERVAREIKPSLNAVVADARQAVSALGDSPTDESVQGVVTSVVDAHRKPVVSITTRQSESATETFDQTTGESIDTPPARAFVAAAIESDESVQDAAYMHAFYVAVSKADDFLAFDAERIGQLSKQEDFITVEQFIGNAERFLKKMRAAGSGLRLVGGSK